MLNDKYRETAVELELIGPKLKPRKKKLRLNFSKQEKRVLYNHEEIEVDIDIEYNYFTSFEILISWHLCSSVIIREFVDNLMTMGRRSKLQPALLSSGNIFNTVWSVTTVGEVIFENHLGLELMEEWVSRNGEWLWDNQDYYFHVTGISFIKF